MNPAPIESSSIGFFALDKPIGASSHDMVASCRRVLPRGTKVGHGGTLDPFAQGVLVIGVGKATRFFDRLHRFPKTYAAVIRLGLLTDSLDLTGTVLSSQPVPSIDQAQLDLVASRFVGELSQMPPAFSAKKVDGVRAYQMARKGQDVVLRPQQIRIDQLELRLLDAEHLQLTVTCSTGTYVRCLGRDIAEAFGTVGHLVELVRESVGPFERISALNPAQFDRDQILQGLIPIHQVFPELAQIQLSREDYEHLLNGRPFSAPNLPPEFLAQFEAEEGPRLFYCKADGELGRVIFRCF
ncbi:MAG: tRNA pseudouridine(55) synthase TruB [Acidobacteria bacterium]|nr:tRNA pseudouridine(55) synthase TruB [Acidobacteriota bacterium]MCB9398896.1 tRNA pseudouridine(55) synthase TruB [Acidobacteriota bacterium]